MRAVTWQGREHVEVRDDVPDPRIEKTTDAVVRVVASGLCGTDLHFYRGAIPGLVPGDILGHEAVGVVEKVGRAVKHIVPGDLVVIPFNIACGRCPMCRRELYSQCETTRRHRFDHGTAMLGSPEEYGHVPGAQADRVRVPHARFGPAKLPDGADPVRATLLADVLPTAAQAVDSADLPKGGSVAIFGLGAIGQACIRIAGYLGLELVIGIDHVPERLAMAQNHDAVALDSGRVEDIAGAVAHLTDGAGVDGVIDAVGMEAEATILDHLMQTTRQEPSRMLALREAIEAVRRGGTISIVGLYADPIHSFPIHRLFDKQIQLRMGHTNVRRWLDDLLPLALAPEDPLGLADLVTDTPSIEEAPAIYERFRDRSGGIVKPVFVL